MVTLSRTKKPVHEPASIVVCLEGFCMSNPRGVDMIAVRGARLRGDSPIVVARPEMFAPEGLSDAEYARLRAENATRRADANVRAHARVLERERRRAPKPVDAKPFYPDALPISAVFGGTHHGD